MSQAEKNLYDAVIALVEEDAALALSVLTVHFVGLAVAMISARGYPDNRDIFIDGGTSRDITIHQKRRCSMRCAYTKEEVRGAMLEALTRIRALPVHADAIRVAHKHAEEAIAKAAKGEA